MSRISDALKRVFTKLGYRRANATKIPFISVAMKAAGHLSTYGRPSAIRGESARVMRACLYSTLGRSM